MIVEVDLIPRVKGATPPSRGANLRCREVLGGKGNARRLRAHRLGGAAAGVPGGTGSGAAIAGRGGGLRERRRTHRGRGGEGGPGGGLDWRRG
eukprot:15440396-Alexandrium_andersonii.AAC.1